VPDYYIPIPTFERSRVHGVLGTRVRIFIDRHVVPMCNNVCYYIYPLPRSYINHRHLYNIQTMKH